MDNFVLALRFVEEHPYACCYEVPLAAPKGGGMYTLHSMAHRKVPKGLCKKILDLTPYSAINHPGGRSYATPLHMAVSNNKVDLVRWLLDHKADVNSVNIFGKSPLDKAITAGPLVEKLLIRAGARLGAQISKDTGSHSRTGTAGSTWDWSSSSSWQWYGRSSRQWSGR